MKFLFRCLVALSIGLSGSAAFAALNVFACMPEWSALAAEIGGDKVSVYAATTAMQDPHRIEARPSLIARARSADLVVCTGAELEIGWLPVVLDNAGNGKIRPGQPGYFEASSFVVLTGVPERLDRAMGDVHPGGNPHVHTDPRNVGLIAAALAQRMAQIDPANAAHYRQRHEAFAQRWSNAISKWERDAAPLKGVMLVQHHTYYDYLWNWLGLQAVGALEPKPGVEPTVSHMTQLVTQQQTRPAKMVVHGSYNDPRASNWFAERAKVPVVMLPATVGGTPEAKDLFSFFDDIVRRLLPAAK